jgi:hypothetical protein
MFPATRGNRVIVLAVYRGLARALRLETMQAVAYWLSISLSFVVARSESPEYDYAVGGSVCRLVLWFSSAC